MQEIVPTTNKTPLRGSGPWAAFGVCGEKIQGRAPSGGALTSFYPDPHKLPPYARRRKKSI